MPLNLPKIKVLLKTVCQRNSTETAQQNFVKLVIMKDIMCRYMYAFLQEILILSFEGAIYIPLNFGEIILCNSDETGFLSDCPSLMLGIAIRCIQHSQAMLERGICELAHFFFHETIAQYPNQ